jgi:hypothetical protein
MYYTWNWWWFVSWFTPMLLLLWVIFGWNSRRYWRSRDDYLRYRDDWGDDIRPPRDPRRFGNRGRGPRNYVRADARIHEDVCDSLTMDDQLDARGIDVSVTGGRVSLNGTVSTRIEKRLAEAIVDAVPGVRDVDNDLQVGEPATTSRTGAGQPSSPSQAAHHS